MKNRQSSPQTHTKEAHIFPLERPTVAVNRGLQTRTDSPGQIYVFNVNWVEMMRKRKRKGEGGGSREKKNQDRI
jgi:hypothetical protein